MVTKIFVPLHLEDYEMKLLTSIIELFIYSLTFTVLSLEPDMSDMTTE